MYNSPTEPSSLAGMNQQMILLMSRYRRCARIYWRHTNKVPSSWDDTAYQMFKVCCPYCKPSVGCLTLCSTIEQDRTPVVDASTTAYRNMPSDDDGESAVSHNRDTGAGKAVIRIRMHHGIQVSLNPLMVPAVTLLFQDMIVNVSRMYPCR